EDDNFLDVKVAGRAGSAAGTGSCASLLVRMGEVEGWALGGAATRWVERLGPQPGVLPESKKSDTRGGGDGGRGGARGRSSSSSNSSTLPRESFLRQALFNGGCNDVI
ncbi:unnamed protein product, partial [Ectocarpus fasciculatus]